MQIAPEAARRYEEIQAMEDQITELAAHIHAATFRLQELIREYDERDGWVGPGLKSCAHWLNWKCGIGLGAAREKVRVAHAIKDLPKISADFREGRVSYSKVRAMTRVATPENEDYLRYIARHGTAAHVERLVRNYRKVKRIEALEAENRRFDLRELDCYQDDDGFWVLRGRLTPEQGERVFQALQAASKEEFQERKDVSAETSRRLACDAAVVRWLENESGETLSVGRKTRTIPPAIRRALQRRDQGCRFPGCTATRFVDAHHICHWSDGGETKLDNLVLLCRHHHRLVHEGGFGVAMSPDGEPRFTDPRGKTLPPVPETRFRGNVFALMAENRRAGVRIDPDTPIPYWYGERMDDHMAVEGLLEVE